VEQVAGTGPGALNEHCWLCQEMLQRQLDEAGRPPGTAKRDRLRQTGSWSYNSGWSAFRGIGKKMPGTGSPLPGKVP
jgi:hypothetical protein